MRGFFCAYLVDLNDMTRIMAISFNHGEIQVSRKITSFISKDIRREFLAACNAALESVAKDFGIVIQVGGGSYMSEEFRTKIVATVKQPESKATAKAASKTTNDPEIERQRASFEVHAHKFGLSKTDLGREVTVHGSRFTIIGVKPSARKNGILIRGARGGRYIASRDDVRFI